MTRAKKVAPLKLDDETFGEQLYRAFRRHKAATGETWAVVTERVSAVRPTYESSVVRLTSLAEVPKTNSGRLLAYCVILAIGYEPADFGLGKDQIQWGAMDPERAADLLIRRSACSSRAA